MSSSSVWVQLYYKGREELEGNPIKIVKKERSVDLNHCNAARLVVYPPGTTPPFLQDKAIDPGDDVPPNMNSKNPLIVLAPTPSPTPQQLLQHINVSNGVFVLYQGDDKDVEPIGTAFAISTKLLLTACHNVVKKEKGGDYFKKTGLKVTKKLVKSAECKICVEGNQSTAVDLGNFNPDVDWASLKVSDENVSFPFVIPIATMKSDTPEEATLEKLYIYHCPVQLFLDDLEMEACHVMVKEASVGIVGRKTLNFQNGAFPGSCGGPYMYRNKAVALHVDSVSTAKIAEDFAKETKTDKLGRKRKLSKEDITRRIDDSCASSHTSLGSGILLSVRTGIMNLLKE